MKVRELLMKMMGACSYWFYDSRGRVIDKDPRYGEMADYLDNSVNHFKVTTFINDIGGGSAIRCHIYLDGKEINSISDITDINYESDGLYGDVQCPYCGARHFALGYGITTSVYCPTIIKDGKVVDNDCNSTTYKCTCCECHKEFTLSGRNKVSKIPGQETTVLDFSTRSL